MRGQRTEGRGQTTDQDNERIRKLIATKRRYL
jgi:hypothetical protein